MQARRAVTDWARSYVEDRAVLSDIALAITEAATNVVLHAYRDHAEPGKVTIEAEYVDDHVCFYVRDEGSGLAPRVDTPGPRPRARADRPGRRLRRRPRARGRRHRGRHALQRLARRLTCMQMRLLRSGDAGSAALELAISHALLTRVSQGELPSTLRVYRPRADGRVRQARPARARLRGRGRGRARPRLRARPAAPRRPRRGLPRGLARDRRRVGARRSRHRHPRPLRDRGGAARGRAARRSASTRASARCRASTARAPTASTRAGA